MRALIVAGVLCLLTGRASPEHYRSYWAVFATECDDSGGEIYLMSSAREAYDLEQSDLHRCADVSISRVQIEPSITFKKLFEQTHEHVPIQYSPTDLEET